MKDLYSIIKDNEPKNLVTGDWVTWKRRGGSERGVIIERGDDYVVCEYFAKHTAVVHKEKILKVERQS